MRISLTSLLLILAIAAPASAQTTAFVGGRLILGGGEVLERGTLIVTDGRITAVGPADRVTIPQAATRIDATGKSIMPGLINAHGHVAATQGLRSSPEFYTRENLLSQLRTYASYGVTTVYSLGDDQAAGFALRDEGRTGPLDRARVFVAGAVITADTADAARQRTDQVADQRPDILKIRVDDNLGTSRKMPEPAWRAAVTRAHERQLRMAVHIFYLNDARATVEGGADFVAHSVRDVAVDAAFAQLLRTRNVCYSPTLTRELSTYVFESTPPFADDPFFVRGVSDEVRRQITDPNRQAQTRANPAAALGQRYKAGLEVAMRNLKSLSDQGVRIAMGTDTGPPGRFQGFFEHLEMEMMADAGLTPAQIIRSATVDAAACHQNPSIGALEVGRQADLLVLGANPLDNIRALRQIEQVWIGGRRLP
jgi:imidazolonepropionase-like amidohydrolase